MRRLRRRSLYLASLAFLAGCARSPVVGPTPVPRTVPVPTPSTPPSPGRPPVGPGPAPPATPPGATASPAARCAPNRADPPGWEYPTDVPERARVGSGYVLSGVVRAAGSCLPIPGARVVLWLANPQGVYDEASRGAVVTGADGAYRFESHPPVPYDGAQPHIHTRTTAPGFRPLMTTHLSLAGQHQPTLDLVLTPG